MNNFVSYNVLLVIATNIAVLLMTAFVLQGHIYYIIIIVNILINIHLLIHYFLLMCNKTSFLFSLL